jgi:hypothetical protein
MGQAVTTARDCCVTTTLDKGVKAEEKESAHYVLEQLSFLVNAANAKLDKYQADLNEMWLDKNGTTAQKMVPGQRALRWERGYRVGVRREPVFRTQDGTSEHKHDGEPDGLDEIINVYFSAGVSGPDVTQKDIILNGFKKHVRTTLHYILENANAGEQEDQRFFVFVQHNAIIRVDIKVWRYNFNSSNVMANAQDVLAYIFCVSVVNHMDLSVDELTYLLSEHAGDLDVRAYVDYLLSVWRKIYEIKHEVNRYKIEWELKFGQYYRQQEERKGISFGPNRYLPPPSPPSSAGTGFDEPVDVPFGRA